MIDLTDYSLLASAIAGRRVALLSLREPGPAYSDGASIWIQPPIPNDAGASAFEWRPIVVQAALMAIGSLEPVLLRRLVARDRSSARYLLLEVVRACALLAGQLPPSLLREVARYDIAPPSNAEESLELALGTQPLPSPADWFGRLRPLSVVAQAVRTGGLNALSARSRRLDPSKDQNAHQDEPPGQSFFLKLLTSPLSASSLFSDLFSKLSGDRQRIGDRRHGEGGSEIAVQCIPQRLKRGASVDIAHLPDESAAIEALLTNSECYDEWDERIQRHRKDWVTALCLQPWREAGPRELGTALRDFGERRLRRQLARLGMDHEMHGAQTNGSDLDTRRLIDSLIDLRTGHDGNAPLVYRMNRRTRRDLGVVIMLDVSGSTGDTAPGHERFDQQLQLAYHLGRSFDMLGDTVELIGFRSWGRRRMQFLNLKPHNERWNSAVMERLAQLDPAGFTRIGAAIRHADRRLQRALRLPNRLILMVTDGLPQDHGYESSYAASDIRMASQEARAAGTACMCLCLGAQSSRKELEAIFGAATLLTIDQPRDVIPLLGPACRKALAQVSRRRTHAQLQSKHGPTAAASL